MLAILEGSMEEVEKYLGHDPTLTGTNFLGQTPLHLAILRPKVLGLLLDQKTIVDPLDRHGITPLMYAAAYGQTSSVLELLDSGADLLLEDKELKRNFLDYAVVRGQWNLIKQVISHVQASPGLHKRYAKYIPTYVLFRHATCRVANTRFGNNYFSEMVRLGANPDMVDSEGMTFLHHAIHKKEAEALLEAGFSLINHQDNVGVSPLMQVVKHANLSLVEFLLKNGANVHQEDYHGRNIFHYIVESINDGVSFRSYAEGAERNWIMERHAAIFQIMKLLLAHGADPLKKDNCSCECSLGSGCSPNRILTQTKIPYDYGRKDASWNLEWLLILKENCRPEVHQEALKCFMVALKFDDIGLTHTCCQGGGVHPMDHDDIFEIKIEEIEYIEELHQYISSYRESTLEDMETLWIDSFKQHLDFKVQQFNLKKEAENEQQQENLLDVSSVT